MGVNSSRERRSQRRSQSNAVTPPANMPPHLANQYSNRRQMPSNGNNVPTAPNYDASRPAPTLPPPPPPQQQQQQQPSSPSGNTDNNNSANNNQRGVQEGQIVKMLATIDASSVDYDPTMQRLKFRVTSVCPFLSYEIHTGVKEYIRGGEVFYMPNKPKMEPPRLTLEGPQENKEINVHIDVSKLEEKERVYNKHYPKQQPCVIVLRYRIKELRKQENSSANASPVEEIVEHTEHTAVDLAENPKRRVISQIITAGGSAYVVEDLFGVDGDSPGAANGNPEVMLGTTIVPHEGEEDEDGLCVICLTVPKDTAVMPCRHMCLCKGCAEELMRHTPKCPVCRGFVSTLLHMPSINGNSPA
ncbi:hypothetical protein C3747_2g43 [Trypanosoma cruzi]|uniref:RING-type domain-containing protein n=2 Tax=Trypanosoma cruzi TaxID=5693 RepID=Q4E000_TRYCC|nr:hypothetical protein, conserved [Trypanosoma cruzi]EAN98093.1 hypothetical protein, conserved [Trypanosoma cruzi]KAF5225814.1 hypothetical protein ECC02_001130 [Trypanosoma cruzi]KAF8292797.1 hypothetical protein TcYC6_0116500 [Trypanosoma cruzi]PWV21389.1 hypothetical protein C3747_2g43 [Trypanosoma cruzi]RNC56052.1 hypothetical protein TcCL_ESM06414 [Trypanosoma cruzi]|eukprot:XP_819944.1 hypothetical protein [Trypanosoma cruzi strain CL Brener]